MGCETEAEFYLIVGKGLVKLLLLLKNHLLFGWVKWEVAGDRIRDLRGSSMHHLSHGCHLFINVSGTRMYVYAENRHEVQTLKVAQISNSCKNVPKTAIEEYLQSRFT